MATAFPDAAERGLSADGRRRCEGSANLRNGEFRSRFSIVRSDDIDEAGAAA